MPRAAAIIIDQNSVALIQRDRAGQRYFVFPGGQVEAGETIEEAAIREVAEEIGLRVTLCGLVAVVAFRGQAQYYYRAVVTGGHFGPGNGPEWQELPSAERGTYTPVWINLADLPHLPVYPAAVATLVHQIGETGWPVTPYAVEES